MITPDLYWIDGCPTVDGAGAELLEELLAEYERRTDVGGNGLSYADGLSDQELDKLSAEHAAILSDELRVWWRWRNGPTPGNRFTVYWEQLPFGRALADRDDMIDPDEWHADWLPIIGQAPAGFSALLGRTATSRIRSTRQAAPTSTTRSSGDADSLCALVCLWLTAMDRGWVHWDSDKKFWDYDRQTIPLQWRETGFL